MTLIWHKNLPFLLCNNDIENRRIPISCIVRNEINGWRKADEIVYTKPGNMPYQPRTFPKGIWTVEWPIAKSKDSYMWPYFIPTNAFLIVPVWEIRDGQYVKQTLQLVRDEEYGLHFCQNSGTTAGCGKIEVLDDLKWLVKTISQELEKDKVVILNVMEP
jgi:hypothetical protein